MEIKHISRFLVVALVVNALLMISAISSLIVFRVRVRDYKPSFPVTDEEILNRIGLATYDYLTNFVAHVESNNTTQAAMMIPRVITADFSIYGALRGDRVIFNNVEYMQGDYIQFDKEVFLILRIDFYRQRIYLRDADGVVSVAVAGAPARPGGRAHGTASETDGNSRKEDDGPF